MIGHNVKKITSIKNTKSFFFSNKLSFHSMINEKTFRTQVNLGFYDAKNLQVNLSKQSAYNFKSQAEILKFTKRCFSSNNTTKAENITEREITFKKNNEENPALIKMLTTNNEKLDILMMKLNLEDEIKDHIVYNKALAICLYCENKKFSLKARKTFLDLFRKGDYSILTKLNSEQNDIFIDYFSNLYNLDLEEKDLKAIENKYFQIKEKLPIEKTIQIYDGFYYYEYFGFKLDKMKKDVMSILTNNYLTMRSENVYNLNSSILFAEPNEIAKFSLFAAEKLFLFTNPEFLKITSLSLVLNCIQPLPKIISEINHSSTIPDKVKKKILIQSTVILNEFFKYVKKDEIDESLLIALSNAYFYANLDPAILELFIDCIYLNLANLPHENLIELFFLLLMSTKKDGKISKNKERLMNQILDILDNIEKEPMIYLNNHKFFIYINNCRKNLNEVFNEWVSKKDKNLKNMSEKEVNLYEKYLKIVNLSINIYPFATKDLSYSEDLLEEIFSVFKYVFKHR